MPSKDGQFKQYNGTNWDDLNPKTKWDLITNKPTNYPPSAHTHSEYVAKQEDIYTYPYIGTGHVRSNTGGQAFKITLPYAGITSSSNEWFMNTFELVIGQSYVANSVCKLYFSYYALKDASNTWSVPNCQVFGVGSNLSNISNIYYVTNNPAIIYITFTNNNYITMSINNLTANDTANSYDFRNTTISLDDLPNTSTLTNISLTYISANANTQEIDVNKKLTVKAPIVAYEYVNSNNAALIMDKPGSNYTGMGAHSIADTIWFGACNGNGNWVDTYKQIWQFNGSIKADSETIGSGGTGSGDSSTSPKLEIDGGTLRLKNYGITVDIGSQNGSYVHFANNSSVPFYFNNGVSVNGSIYENGTSLASKYLGISATAADSSKLNGQNPSYYLNYNNLNNKPTIGNATLNIKTEGTLKGTFGANATSNVEINITAADLGLSAALKFLGTTTTALSDGATTNPITVGGSSVTVANGNVVIYGNKEFLWNGSSWEELGDESSYALKTVTITGTGALTGGGSLEQNRTINLNSGGADTQGLGFYKFSTDAYSRIGSVTPVTKGDITALISGEYLPLSGGTISGSDYAPLTIRSTYSNSTQGAIIYFEHGTTRKASVGYYNDLAFIGNESSPYAKIGLKMDGTPVYSPDNATTQYTLLHTGNVSSWALQSTKPSYNYSEINAGNITMGDGTNFFRYRTASGLDAGFYLHTAQSESVVFANEYSLTGWMFVNGVKPSDRTDWRSLSPTLHIAKGGVYINKLIANGETPTYNLDVNGSANATTVTIAAKATMQYNTSEDCIDFIFN